MAREYNFDGIADRFQCYGDGDSDVYVVGDWNGDGKDNLAVRRGADFSGNTREHLRPDRGRPVLGRACPRPHTQHEDGPAAVGNTHTRGRVELAR